MADDLNTEERLAYLERELARLRSDIETEKLQQVRVNEQQSDVSRALLATTDDILLVHIKRLEHGLLDGVNKIMGNLRIADIRLTNLEAEQRNIGIRLDSLETHIASIPEILANHKEAIERIESKVDVTSGQLAEILAILTGEQKRND